MGISLDREFAQRDFAPGSLANAFRKALELFRPVESRTPQFKVTRSVGKDGTADGVIEISDVGLITHIQDNPSRISVISSISVDDYDGVFLSGTEKSLRLHVASNTAEKASELADLFKKELNLTEYSPLESKELGAEVDGLRARIERLESASRTRLSVFISYRFSQTNKIPVGELTRFLELLGVEVLTGASYEPRSVSEKVKDRLAENVDLLVYLISDSGESAWLRDEVASSHVRGAYVAPLVQKGLRLDPGMLGDVEYLRFEKGHVGDTFIGLVEALEYVRRKKDAKESQQKRKARQGPRPPRRKSS
jgi:hypothetical protein